MRGARATRPVERCCLSHVERVSCGNAWAGERMSTVPWIEFVLSSLGRRCSIKPGEALKQEEWGGAGVRGVGESACGVAEMRCSARVPA